MPNAHFERIANLVNQSQAGDQAAKDQLVTFYKPLLRSAVRRLLIRNPRLTPYREDVSSIASLAFVELASHYEEAKSYFSWYLASRLDRAIEREVALEFPHLVASAPREIPFSDIDPEFDIACPDDPFGRIEFRVSLDQALSFLSDQQRLAIEEVYFNGLTQKDAADKLGISQASLCKRLQRALKALRSSLSDDDLDSDDVPK